MKLNQYFLGLGAQSAIITSLKQGDGILVDRHVNLPTIKLLNKFAVNMGMEVKFADFNDLKSLEEHLTPNLKVAWFETPSMPSMKVIDIKSIADFFHEKSQARVVVDNTTLSSYLQRPLGLGADIVIYSITKYMHGHSDVVMGSLAINDDKIHEKLKYHQGATGIIPSPFDWWVFEPDLKFFKHNENFFNVFISNFNGPI
jgi:cystathionine gamma-lyase